MWVIPPDRDDEADATDGTADQEQDEVIHTTLGAEDARKDDVVTIGVLESSWRAVQVFCDCQWTAVAGVNGVAYLGIAAAEIESACRLQRVPVHERPRVLLSITRIMVPAARPHMNK